jgi:hypothetical protein
LKNAIVRLAILALAAALLIPQAAVIGAATVLACQNPSITPTKTVYMPNITKTLGGTGTNGWDTPFIVQNVGSTSTTIELSFYKFTDGSFVACHRVEGLGASASFDWRPLNDTALPNDTQFSVVVRSFGAPIVGVVNEIVKEGTTRFEASSYNAVSGGATSVFLPNIAKRYFGWVTRFVIQNLGSKTTLATANFISFDGTKTATITRLINPGQSQFIDPNVEPLLVDGTQYAVTVNSDQGVPIAVRVGTQNDEAGVAHPVVDATMGATLGAASIYGPYAVKNVSGKGKGLSTIVVQNLAATPVDMTLTFAPLGGGSPITFNKTGIAAKASWDFDPRFQNGNAKASPQVICGATAGPGCLANGEYSFVASTTTAGGTLAAVVNVVGDVTGDTTLAQYTPVAAPATTLFLPNMTRTLGGANAWTTPTYLQNTTASQATASIEWRRFSDQQLLLTENLTIPANASMMVDPRQRSLPENTQFAVKVTSGTALAGIVMELNFGDGDGAMAYNAFAPIQSDPVPATKTRFQGTVTNANGTAAANVCVKVGSVPNCTTLTAVDGSYSYELDPQFAVSYTFHYLVNGVEKASQTINPPYTGGTTVTLPSIALTP